MTTTTPPASSASAVQNQVAQQLPSLSVVVPTYKEALNLPELLRRLAQVRSEHHLEMEVLIMDDNSADGSAEAVAAFGAPWVEFVARHTDPGLSPAVTEGLLKAKHEVVAVMDADLSHPPEKLPEFLATLAAGADFVVGSRYVAGGTTDDDWGMLRWLNSQVATTLARPLTDIRDPMAGYFALWRSSLKNVQLNAVGYKIGLELIVKCRIKKAVEVPIHFSDRIQGESKLTLKQQLLYFQHLRRLYIFRYAGFTELAHFATVGSLGVLVNLLVLRGCLMVGIPEATAVAVAIGTSMLSNFLLHRRFTFSYARHENIWKQLAGFCSASIVGASVNYAATVGLRYVWPKIPLEVAALVGIAAGLGFNFLANRYFVFKKKHYRESLIPPAVTGQLDASNVEDSPSTQANAQNANELSKARS